MNRTDSSRTPVRTYGPPRFVRAMIALNTLHVTLGALSTYALALAGQHSADARIFLRYLAAFLIFSVLPNACVLFIRRVEMRGYLDMYAAFLRSRFARQGGRPALWSARTQRERYLTAIGPDAESYLSAVGFSTFDLYSFALTIVLNGVALSLAVDWNFAAALILAALLSGGVFWWRRDSVRALVAREQTARVDLGAYVLRAWDNVLLKNDHVRARYARRLDEHFVNTRDLAGRAAFAAELTVVLLYLASALPVFAWIGFELLRDLDQPARLVALLVTVPRQMEILRTFRYLFQQANNTGLFKLRLATAVENSELTAVNLTTLIDPMKISIDGVGYSSRDELMHEVLGRPTGRRVIRGGNGAGKSSLLLLIHQDAPRSVYLPPAADLECDDEDPAEESTGQRLRRQLARARAVEVPVLLLDEWDANLDVTTRTAIDRDLDEIARTRLVVEVRHHGG